MIREPLTFDRLGPPINYDPVVLQDYKWLIAEPVLAGMCSYRDVTDGSVSIMDCAEMCEWIAVRNENEARSINSAKDD